MLDLLFRDVTLAGAAGTGAEIALIVCRENLSEASEIGLTVGRSTESSVTYNTSVHCKGL